MVSTMEESKEFSPEALQQTILDMLN
jgi:hypothetical protein